MTRGQATAGPFALLKPLTKLLPPIFPFIMAMEAYSRLVQRSRETVENAGQRPSCTTRPAGEAPHEAPSSQRASEANHSASHRVEERVEEYCRQLIATSLR